MKRDKKFIIELEEKLNDISDKKRDIIVLKYQKIINSELKNKRKITDILNELGSIDEIVKKEKNNLKEEKILNRFWKFITKKRFMVLDKEINIKKETKSKKIKVKKSKKNKSKKKFNIIKYMKEIISKIKNMFSKINLPKITVPKLFIKEDINDIENNNIEIDDNVVYESSLRSTVKIMCIILISLLLVLLFIFSSLFFTSIIAYLDGIKFIGVVIAILGIDFLLILLINRVKNVVFNRVYKNKLLLKLIISSVVIISLGAALTIKKINDVTFVKDISEKYSMTSNIETIKLPSNNSKLNIIFNSEYDIQYSISYDSKLNDKIKIETKYYNAYYGYFMKKSSNDIYVHLSSNFRDRFSICLNGLKDNKIYSQDELKRYYVKISVNEKDYSRINIQD